MRRKKKTIECIESVSYTHLSPFSTFRGCKTSILYTILWSERRKTMDQVKIGKFISDERKAKGYTPVSYTHL